MKIEHVAFNVEDPLAMGRWYVEHLGFKVKRRTVDPPYAHFLADDSGTVMIEIYGNPESAVPDYQSMNPLMLHLALVSKDIESDIARLKAAGATLVGELQTAPNGDQLAMLRDPWGFAVQLVKRDSPMI
jgi:catechol 2,3-dioxygenase-like lactoylglutathione lyase family enzyme